MLLKNNLRVCCIVEPNFKQIIAALLTSNGLVQGFTNADEVAVKLIEFLNQLPLVVCEMCSILK